MARAWLGKTHAIRKLSFGLAAGITTIMAIVSWLGPHAFARLENSTLDLRFKIRGERVADTNIVLVGVDENSLREQGRWPWSRDKQARLVETIAADGAKVIGLDIMYTEAEITDYLRGLSEIVTAANKPGAASPGLRHMLSSKLTTANTDRRFVSSLKAAKNVVLALPLLVPKSAADVHGSGDIRSPDFIKRSEFMLVRYSKSGAALEPYRASEVHSPLQSFAENALSLGHVYSVPDPDGVTRYEYPVLRHGDSYYPSLGLEVARLYLGIPRDRMALVLGAGIHLGERVIPTDQKSRMLINYLGPERTFPFVSATDVIHQRFLAGTFRGKAVLVGTAALGTYDQKATPFSANFPGIEKNATVMENIINGRFVHKTIWAGPLDVVMLVSFGLSLGLILPRMRALPGACAALSLVAAFAGLAQYLFVTYGMWLDVVPSVMTITLVFVCLTVLRFMSEEQQAAGIRAMFSSYVSPQIVEELIRDPAKAALGGYRRELTMLFCDVTDFTGFSEKHAAEEVVAQLNEYLSAMTDIIFYWNGTLDKFVGDAIVVFWGAPLDQPNHVELATKCALDMRRRMTELQEKWRHQGKDPFEHGIGLNTGMAVVGNIGAEGKKMDYTMIGDHVNLAARAEGLTRAFHCAIVMTHHTAERLKDLIAVEDRRDNRGRVGHVLVRRLDTVTVKGRAQPLDVYSLESLRRDEPSRFEEHALRVVPAGDPR